MNPHYAQVAERAGHRCEYCRAPEAIFNFPFEVEHIVPPGRGGVDAESNWALSCRACNLFKGSRIEAADLQTGFAIPLFHPRRHRWRDHFSVDRDGEIVGLSDTGRVTVATLRMNRPVPLEARKHWMRLKLFPGF